MTRVRSVATVLTVATCVVLWTAGVAQATPPANDAYADAQLLTGATTFAGTLVAATRNGSDPAPLGSTERDVWFQWQAPASGTWTFDLCGPDATPVRVTRYIAGAPPSQVGFTRGGRGVCDGAGTVQEGALTFEATASTMYAFEVAQSATDAPGPFSGRVYRGPNTFLGSTSFGATKVLGIAGGAHEDVDCSIDGGPQEACDGGLSLAGLSEGPHVVRAAAHDGADADPTPAVGTFTVDDTAPDTAVTVADAASSSPSFAFSSTEPSVTYECAVDSLPFAMCGASYAPTFAAADLCAGAHTLRVAAFDAAGNVDPTPASVSFGAPSGACSTPRARTGTPSASQVPGRVDPGGDVATWALEYGSTPAYGHRSPNVLVAGALDDTAYAENTVAQVNGVPGTTVHYRIVAQLASGGSLTTADATTTVQGTGADAMLPGTPTATATTITIPFSAQTAVPLADSPIAEEVPSTISADVASHGIDFGYADVTAFSSDGATHTGVLHLEGLQPDTDYQVTLTGSTAGAGGLYDAEPLELHTLPLPPTLTVLPPPLIGTVKDTIAPTFAGKLKLKPARLTHTQPVTVSFSLSEAATLTAVRTGSAAGVRHGNRCLPPPAHHRMGERACRRALPKHTSAKAANVGAGTLSLGRLAAGRYTLTLTAKDAAGNVSRRAKVSFTVN